MKYAITKKLRELGLSEKQVQFLRRWIYRHKGFRASTIKEMHIEDNEFWMFNEFDEGCGREMLGK